LTVVVVSNSSHSNSPPFSPVSGTLVMMHNGTSRGHLQTYKHLKYIKTPLWLRGRKGEVCATAGLLSNSFVYNGEKKLSTLTLALDM
jgi:hypothetical protein